MPAYTNRFGRQWGRGWRPWVLIPKVLAVIMFGGGLLAVSVLLHTQLPPPTAPPHAFAAVPALFHWLIIPGSTAAVVLGGVLLLPHAPILLRSRWLRVKLALVLVGLPAAHVLAYLNLQPLKAGVWDGHALAAHARLTWIVDATLVLFVLVVILGRQKPRLGERYGTRQAPP